MERQPQPRLFNENAIRRSLSKAIAYGRAEERARAAAIIKDLLDMLDKHAVGSMGEAEDAARQYVEEAEKP